ncbi:MAG TPA: hypothetical protein VGO52_14245 [Hyphomonadaceae bacterium]|jgi:hypothetical protein|nr:hypothetical protein [Hyphomonadaceae bacterium]
MMLDKGQIKDWDGEPEDESSPTAKPAAAAAPPEMQARSEVDAPLARKFGEGVPTGESVHLTDAQAFARKRRGQWLALGLFAFVILLFVLTMTKIGGRIVNWGGAFTPEQGTPIE